MRLGGWRCLRRSPRLPHVVTRALVQCLVVLCLGAIAGCAVTMTTRATSVPGFASRPQSLFVVSHAPQLDKYMYGVGRRAAKSLVQELRARGLQAWSYDQGSLNLNRRSLEDSLGVCEPMAVLVLNEKLGLMANSWGATSVKEFEFESNMILRGSDQVVWRARTTGKVSGSPSLRDSHLKLAEQILAKLTADQVIPPAGSGQSSD